MKAIINFLFEVGMLKKTPRTGYQFLGSGRESVAEHTFRTAIIGYILSLEEKVDPYKTILMCLLHDLPEARTGDHNYVNKHYVHVDEDKAVEDMSRDLYFGDVIRDLTREFNQAATPEAYRRWSGGVRSRLLLPPVGGAQQELVGDPLGNVDTPQPQRSRGFRAVGVAAAGDQ